MSNGPKRFEGGGESNQWTGVPRSDAVAERVKVGDDGPAILKVARGVVPIRFFGL